MGTPADAFSAGMQGGLQAAQQGVQTQIQRNQLQQLQAYQGAVAGIVHNPDSSPQDYAKLAAQFPQFAQQVQTAQGVQFAAQQRADLTTASQVYGALESGNTDIATSILQNKLQAQQNSGDSDANIQSTQHWLDMIKSAPGYAKRVGGVYLAQALGPDKFTAAFGGLNSAENANELQPAAVQQAQATADTASATAANAPQAAALAVQKQQADIQDVMSTMQNRAATFGLDVDKFNTDTQMRMSQLQYEQRVPKLGDGMGAVQAQSVANATQAQQMSAQASELAQQAQAQANEGGSGVTNSVGRTLREWTGDPNQIDVLRKQYAQLRAQGIGTLKSFVGSMTNKDMDFLKEGFPPDNAPLTQVSGWLSNFSRLQARVAQAENAKAEWISQAGTIGAAPADIRVSGVLVPKGLSFNEFLAKNPNLGEPLAQPNIKNAPGQPGPGAGVLTPQNGPTAPAAVPSYMKYAQ